MKKRELSDDIIECLEATAEEVVVLLSNFNVGEYWEKPFTHSNLQDTIPLQRYMDKLRNAGLDIGKGNSEFGYRMPIPEKNTSIRYLHIYRNR
jgi:hypothetical protein